jgi:hypothetical protein
MNKVLRIVGGLVVVGVIVGAALAGVNFAQAQEISVDAAANVPENCPGEVSEEFRTYMKGQMQAVMAEALGMSVEELQAAEEAGQNPRDLAEERGIEAETLRETMQAARLEAIEQAVSDGLITQEQADWLSTHNPRGGRGGMGGGRPGGKQGRPNGGNPNGEQSEPASGPQD